MLFSSSRANARSLCYASAAVLFAAVMIVTQSYAATTTVSAPMKCTRGPSGTTFDATVTMPASLPPGAKFTVRIDSQPSGKISHTGLNYIFGMTTDYLVPTNSTYVEGSVAIVPDTGTANVRAGARAWHDADGIHFTLPAHVENGSSYTPPSIEFSAVVDGPVGKDVELKFQHYEVQANAIIVGDVTTSCDPDPKPYTIDTLKISAPAKP